MKTILVPTNFTANAETALYFAMRLAKQQGSSLLLLHVAGMPGEEDASTLEEIKLSEDRRKEAQDRLALLSRQIDFAGDIEYEFLVDEGETIDCIAKTANQKKAAFIVMGAPNGSSFSDFAFGTTTAGVIEKASCPVLVIPEGTKLDKPV